MSLPSQIPGANSPIRVGDLLYWYNNPEQRGRLRRGGIHSNLGVELIPGGWLIDYRAGAWLSRLPSPSRTYWAEQEIGVGVVRCPETYAYATQPARTFRRRTRSPSPRHLYVIERRLAGASYAEIGRDLGVTPERVRQLVKSMTMGWR